MTGEHGLFDEYVNCFLKLKAEASGWPAWVLQGDEKKIDENKDLFIKQFQWRENVVLEKENINYNPGMRALAKLMLNSFWGKYKFFC